MKFNREQFVALMAFGDFERPMFSELFGPLLGLEEQWRAQGASEAELNLTAFDWDYVPYTDCGVNMVAFNTPPGRVLEETDEYRIEVDYLGRTTKLCKQSATIGLPLNYPVSRPEDWYRIKPYFEFCQERINREQMERARALQQAGAVVTARIPGGWGMLRELMGEEQACLAFFDWPEVIQDIFATFADTTRRCLEQVCEFMTIDQLSVHEDMAGKSGPLVGPAQIHEVIGPYYRQCWEIASSYGTRLFSQDSDGNMNPVIDVFMDYGVNVMFPFEPNSDMDIVQTRQRCGRRLAMLGGIDKFALLGTKEDIRRELEYKMQPLMRDSGGIVFGLDHRIPNGVPLENYRYYVQLGREILGLEPLDGRRRGWGRMAF